MGTMRKGCASPYPAWTLKTRPTVARVHTHTHTECIQLLNFQTDSPASTIQPHSNWNGTHYYTIDLHPGEIQWGQEVNLVIKIIIIGMQV